MTPALICNLTVAASLTTIKSRIINHYICVTWQAVQLIPDIWPNNCHWNIQTTHALRPLENILYFVVQFHFYLYHQFCYYLSFDNVRSTYPDLLVASWNNYEIDWNVLNHRNTRTTCLHDFEDVLSLNITRGVSAHHSTFHVIYNRRMIIHGILVLNNVQPSDAIQHTPVLKYQEIHTRQ